MENGVKLKKELSFFTVLMLVIGIVIGSGVFYKPHALYTATGAAPGIGILAWIVGGVLSYFGALTSAELSAAIPKTGGIVEWMRASFGDIPAFLLGWAQSVVVWPAFIAALGTIFAQTAVVLLGISTSYVLPITIATVIFLAVLNSLSTKLSGKIGSISTICKLIPLALIIVVGLTRGPSVGNGVANLTPFLNPESGVGFLSALSGGVLATLYAYQGWIDAGAVAGEMKNPERDLPKALGLGLLIIALVYTLVNIAYLFVLPAGHFVESATPALDVANVLFGTKGALIINVGILVSVFGAMNANMMAGIRAPYALSLNDELPFSGWLKKLNPKTQTPVNSCIYISVVTCIFCTTGSYDFLTNITVVTMWMFYVMVFFGVIKLRHDQPDLVRPYRCPGYPIVPIIAILGGAGVVILSLMNDFSNNIIGIAITFLGLPVYFIMKSYKNRKAAG